VRGLCDDLTWRKSSKIVNQGPPTTHGAEVDAIDASAKKVAAPVSPEQPASYSRVADVVSTPSAPADVRGVVLGSGGKPARGLQLEWRVEAATVAGRGDSMTS